VLTRQLGYGRKIHCVTTDEGKNFLSAVDSLKDSETVRESLRCACHRVQLVAKRAYMDDECKPLRALLDKCCQVVNQFKNGWTSTKRDILRKHQANYVDAMKAELKELQVGAAIATRAVQAAVQARQKSLKEAEALLAKENETTNSYDVARAEASQELVELAIVPVDQNMSLDDDSVDLKVDDENSVEEEEVISAEQAQKITDAKSQRAFVDYIFNKRALIQRAVTRWLSYVGVVERCVIWRKPLMEALAEISSSKSSKTDLASLQISEQEEIILKQFLMVGRACRQVLEQLEGDRYVTISKILYEQSRLVRVFAKVASSTSGFDPMIITFCKKASTVAGVKFSSQVDKAAMISTILDPRFKSLSFLNAAEKGECWDALTAAYHGLEIELGQDSKPADSPQPHKKRKVNDKNQGIDYTADILAVLSPTKAPVLTELEKYAAYPDEERNNHPLDWWKMHGSRFPNLSILARRYLAIPASSASSERLFSRLKLTATAARQGLKPATLCQLLFLACHQQRLETAPASESDKSTAN
jgi:hypothetical protein